MSIPLWIIPQAHSYIDDLCVIFINDPLIVLLQAMQTDPDNNVRALATRTLPLASHYLGLSFYSFLFPFMAQTILFIYSMTMY